jgi:hypothetical protein
MQAEKHVLTDEDYQWSSLFSEISAQPGLVHVVGERALEKELSYPRRVSRGLFSEWLRCAGQHIYADLKLSTYLVKRALSHPLLLAKVY